MPSKVSVIIGTKGRPDLLSRAVYSVLTQTYVDLECIVIDASTKINNDLCNKFKDNRLKYLHLKSDPGRERTLKLGISMAKGNLICFLDDDDVYLPDKILEQVNVYRSSSEDLAIVYCWGMVVDEISGKVLEKVENNVRGDVYEKTLKSMSLCSFISLMFRKEFIDEEKMLDLTSEEYPSDWYYINKLTRKYVVDYVPKHLFEIRSNHQYERMSKKTVLSRADALKRIRFHMQFIRDNREGFRLYPKSKLIHLSSIIGLCGISGQLSIAFKCFIKGIWISPLDLNLYRKILGAMYRIIQSWI
jgi:glycosyltransferase involved in cell wall biosynthesis